jgi:hypothetical protein
MTLDLPTILILLLLVGINMCVYWWWKHREKTLRRQRCLREIESAGGLDEWKRRYSL